MDEWEEASPSVVHTAQQLIRQYHPLLVDARTGFVFRKRAMKSRGQLVLAQTQLVNARLQVFLDYDFLIWVSKEDWEQLTESQRLALIDHELSHCIKNWVTDRWEIRPHDVQEFWHILDRHGFWSIDLMRGRAVMERTVQRVLPLGEEPAGAVSAVSIDALRYTEASSDDLIEEVKRFVAEEGGEISATRLQRRFSIGYPRAKQLLEQIQTVQKTEISDAN